MQKHYSDLEVRKYVLYRIPKTVLVNPEYIFVRAFSNENELLRYLNREVQCNHTALFEMQKLVERKNRLEKIVDSIRQMTSEEREEFLEMLDNEIEKLFQILKDNSAKDI